MYASALLTNENVAVGLTLGNLFSCFLAWFQNETVYSYPSNSLLDLYCAGILSCLKKKKMAKYWLEIVLIFRRLLGTPSLYLTNILSPWLDLVFMAANNLKAAIQWPLESCEFYFNLLSHLIMQSIDFNSILFSVRGCQVHYALFTLNHCKRDQAASGSALIQNIHMTTKLQDATMVIPRH